MTNLRWKPFGDLLSMHDDIHRFFEGAFGGTGKERGSETSWCPPTDIFETKDNYVFKLEVPGISKKDIHVELKGNNLTIEGEKREPNKVKKENYHRVESYSGKFSRTYSLPGNVDPKKVEAHLEDGILELRLGKREEEKAKTISINLK